MHNQLNRGQCQDQARVAGTRTTTWTLGMTVILGRDPLVLYLIDMEIISFTRKNSFHMTQTDYLDTGTDSTHIPDHVVAIGPMLPS